MARLLRPHISTETRVRVALAQLGEMFVDQTVREARAVYRGSGGLQAYLTDTLAHLAELLAVEPRELRLDHQPALCLRDKVFKKGVHVDYRPPASSAEHLIYAYISRLRSPGLIEVDGQLLRRTSGKRSPRSSR